MAILEAISVGSAIASAAFGLKARSKAKKANKLRGRIDAINTMRERTAVQRNARIQLAQIEAQAAAAGLSKSSGIEGQVGGFTSQVNSGLGYANQINNLNTRINKLGAKQAKYADYSSLVTAVPQVAGAIGGSIGGSAKTFLRAAVNPLIGALAGTQFSSEGVVTRANQ